MNVRGVGRGNPENSLDCVWMGLGGGWRISGGLDVLGLSIAYMSTYHQFIINLRSVSLTWRGLGKCAVDLDLQPCTTSAWKDNNPIAALVIWNG